MTTHNRLLNQLITSMADAVRAKAAAYDNLEDVAAEAATSTGLRRVVWATLTDSQKVAAVKAAVRRGKGDAYSHR